MYDIILNELKGCSKERCLWFRDCYADIECNLNETAHFQKLILHTVDLVIKDMFPVTNVFNS
jgi:hypothetical protein